MKSKTAVAVMVTILSVQLTACQLIGRNDDGKHQPVPEQEPIREEDVSIIDESNRADPVDTEALREEFASNAFKREQLRFPRVRTAVEEKYLFIKELFGQHGINYPPKGIFLRAFKEEKVLELWVKPDNASPYVFLKSYDICRSSGELGPKRQEGDMQVPEGFYHIRHFNPSSNFYLSLGINYPNASDSILGVRGDLGGDIYIHGGCATIGCIPITDDKIKELYLIAVEAKSGGQEKIPVHIFPARMDDGNLDRLQREYGENQELMKFWKNLKEGFDLFEETRQIPVFSVDSRGKYVFAE